MENPPTVIVKPFPENEEEKVTEIERFRRAASFNKKLTKNEVLSVKTFTNAHTQRVQYDNQVADWESGISSYTRQERIGFGFEEDAEEIDTGSGWANIDLLGSGSKNDMFSQEIAIDAFAVPPLVSVLDLKDRGIKGQSGISVRAHFFVEEEEIVLGLEIQNHCFEPLSEFDIMFDRNSFGLYICGQVNKIKVPAS